MTDFWPGGSGKKVNHQKESIASQNLTHRNDTPGNRFLKNQIYGHKIEIKTQYIVV